MKIKLKDLTKEQYEKWLLKNCRPENCKKCVLHQACYQKEKPVEEDWFTNKNLYSEGFLNQKVKIVKKYPKCRCKCRCKCRKMFDYFRKRKEKWAYIAKTNKRFAVSTMGRVYDFANSKMVKQYDDNRGYLGFLAKIDGKLVHFKTHREVCKAFLPNPLALPEVNHKNFNTYDNRLKNLEWCTTRYNRIYKESTKKKYSKVELKKIKLGIYDFHQKEKSNNCK